MAKADKIYLLTGAAGEYSDTSWWVVCAFESEKEAKAAAHDLNTWVADEVDRGERSNIPSGEIPGDPEGIYEYQSIDTIEYGYESVPIGWKVPGYSFVYPTPK